MSYPSRIMPDNWQNTKEKKQILISDGLRLRSLKTQIFLNTCRTSMISMFVIPATKVCNNILYVWNSDYTITVDIDNSLRNSIYTSTTFTKANIQDNHRSDFCSLGISTKDKEWVSIRPKRFIGFYSGTTLKQQSEDRYAVPNEHIILMTSQPVFARNP